MSFKEDSYRQKEVTQEEAPSNVELRQHPENGESMHSEGIEAEATNIEPEVHSKNDGKITCNSKFIEVQAPNAEFKENSENNGQNTVESEAMVNAAGDENDVDNDEETFEDGDSSRISYVTEEAQMDEAGENSGGMAKVNDSEELNSGQSMNPEATEASEINPLVQESPEKLTKFRIANIKRIMKLDPDVKFASKEATFLIACSLELFVEALTWEANRYAQGKKIVTKSHVDTAIEKVDALAFLDGAMDD